MQLTSSRIMPVAGVVVFLIVLGFVFRGQETLSAPARISEPDDWSHHHVVFSSPTTLEQSLRVKQDPRFWLQWYRRNVRQAIAAQDSGFDESRRREEDFSWFAGDWFGWFGRRHHRRTPRSQLKRDWAMSLGPNASVGADNYPAKFSFDITTANCGNAAQPDFVVFNTGVSTSSQASIVAYDNLYSGCSGGGPTTYWAYNTGGSVVTSVALSFDGLQVAFVQTPTSSTTANLVLLKWSASADGATSTSPDSISIVTPSEYATCTAPCMVTLPFSGGANDTLSSPFIDYPNDALYVGDDAGALHKFQSIFEGVPFEVTTGWPVSLTAGAFKISSPVYDSATGRVFVGSLSSGGTTGGRLYALTASSGAIAGTSSQLAKGNGIMTGPIVDSSAGQVYVFVGTDTGNGTCFEGGTSCSAVYQFPTNFSSGMGIETRVSRAGNAGATFTMYTGDFDNAYYTSANATGNLYVCGNTEGIANLFRVTVNSGVMSTTTLVGPNLASFASPGNLPCGPVSEVFNTSQNSGNNSGGPGGTDKIFVSTTGPGTTNPCFNNGTGGCILDFPVTAWQPKTAYTAGQEILDSNMNIQVVTTAGTSGTPTPTWGYPDSTNFFTVDGSAEWVWKEGLGTLSGLAWTANTSYGQGGTILDTHGNLEVMFSTTGTTGTSQPSWPLGVGSETIDGSANWVNVGPLDSFFLTVPGGTSGIVVDNTVPTGTLAGGSEVYFSPLTLGFGTCGAGNGCAVQASQAALK
jgi:hypothetical protein